MMAKDWNMTAKGFDPRPSNCVSYNNGNYTVTLSLADGTMIRYSKDDKLVPSFPDSMDIKITNCCSLNCRYCHEKSTKNGQHGDILSDNFIDKLHPYTQLACLAGDTTVHTEYGAKNISELKVGDKIYDSEYKLRTVVSIQTKQDSYLTIKGNRGFNVQCSKDHPFYSNNVKTLAEDIKEKTQIDVISSFDDKNNEEPIICDMSKYIHHYTNPRYKNTQSGYITDDNKVVLCPHTPAIPRRIILNEDLMWLYGLYVAEGSSKSFVLHEKETDFANRIKQIWKDNFKLDCAIYYHPEKHSQAIEPQSKSVMDAFFIKYLQAGHGARNKTLSFLYKVNNKKFIRNALRGLYDGDGCIRTRKRGDSVFYSLSLKTTSKTLAYDVAFLIAKWFGIYASVFHGISPEREIEGRTLQSSDYYMVDVYGLESCKKLFPDYTEWQEPKMIQHRRQPILKAKDIIENSDEQALYDITLDGGTHIFPINGYVLTHNCGGGNVLEHPDFVPFLKKCKKLKLVPSVTVNQIHFMQQHKFLKQLTDEKLIYGLGISFHHPDKNFLPMLRSFPNAVIHTIAGITKERDYEFLADNGLKILILGYKKFGRGMQAYQESHQHIDYSIMNLKHLLPHMVKEKWFDSISFDNLALEQLDVKSLMPQDKWDMFYMGDEGSSTMYVDMVNREFAANSTSKTRYPLLDNVEDMLKVIHQEKKGKDID